MESARNIPMFSAADDDDFLAQLEKKRETMFKPSDQPVLAAASRGDIAEMKEILRTNPNLASQLSQWGFTPAHYAGACGQDDMLSFLAGIDPKLLMAQNDYGQTPMHYAAANGQIRAVRILARKVPQVLQVQSNDGRTSLDMARSGKCRDFLHGEMERRSNERDEEIRQAQLQSRGCMTALLVGVGLKKDDLPAPSRPRTPPPGPVAAPIAGRTTSTESVGSTGSNEQRRPSPRAARGRSFDFARILKGSTSRHFDSQVV